MPVPDEPWFRVRDAVANGFSRGALKSRQLEVPFYGIRARAGFIENVENICAAYAEKIPSDSAFTGVTAARLWQMPLPAYLGFDIRTVDVAARAPRRSPRGIHVNGCQYDSRISRLVPLRGLPVLSAVDTWCSLATLLDPMDLVAVADHLVADRDAPQLATCTLEELRRAVELRRGTRGQVALRWALERVRPRAWSRTESLTRLVLTGVGIPEPVLNLRFVVPGHRFNIDLAWPDFCFGLEYDGGGHRDVQRFADDIRRQEIIQDEPWSLMRATKADLFDRTGEFVRRVEKRLVERGCRMAVQPSKLAIPRR